MSLSRGLPRPDNVGVVGYGIYKGGVLISTTAGTTGIVGGLACGTNYTLAVDAFDASGNNSDEVVVMVATTPCADVSAPTAPKGITVSTPTSTGLTLGWTASTDDVGVTGYDVYRNGTKIGSSTTPKYVVRRTDVRNDLYVRRRSVRRGGNRSTQASLATTTPACALSSTGALLISPSGSDSNPCTSTAPCQSLDRAYKMAKPGQTVQVASGTYRGQNIFPDTSKSSSSDVVFQPIPGATVAMTGQIQPGCNHCTFDGSTGTWKWQGGFEVGYPDKPTPSVTDITLKHIDARGGQSQILNATAVTLDDLDIGGNCDGSDALRLNDPTGTDGDSGDPADVVVTGSRIGGICRPSSADHPDCIAVSAGHNVTFSDNRVWACGSQGLYMINELGGNIHDVVVENNMFGDCDTAGDYNTCTNSLIVDRGVSNVVIRNNSFAVNTVGAGMRVTGGNNTGIQVYGNAGEGPGCETTGTTYSYNVWDDAKCSSTDTMLDPMFVSNAGSAFDLHLRSGSPAVGRGDPSRYPSSDFDGQLRTSPPDAGADQR